MLGMRNSYMFYAKLFKYILEKYYNPEITGSENYKTYKVIINNESLFFDFSPQTYEWLYCLPINLTEKDLRDTCIRFANFIGYE
jgi:hypothetical protein